MKSGMLFWAFGKQLRQNSKKTTQHTLISDTAFMTALLFRKLSPLSSKPRANISGKPTCDDCCACRLAPLAVTYLLLPLPPAPSALMASVLARLRLGGRVRVGESCRSRTSRGICKRLRFSIASEEPVDGLGAIDSANA